MHDHGGLLRNLRDRLRRGSLHRYYRVVDIADIDKQLLRGRVTNRPIGFDELRAHRQACRDEILLQRPQSNNHERVKNDVPKRVAWARASARRHDKLSTSNVRPAIDVCLRDQVVEMLGHAHGLERRWGSPRWRPCHAMPCEEDQGGRKPGRYAPRPRRL